MRAALVTGAARRIGRNTALRLAQAGYAVAIHCNRSRHDGEEVRAAIEAMGGQAAVVTGDLADASAVATVVPQAVAALGPLTLLVNNASVFDQDVFATMTPEGYARNMAVNLQAPLFLSQAFARQAAPAAEALDDPSIVHMIDQRVLKQTPEAFSYALAKSALWAATRTMAQSLAPAVRVNAVGPGPTLANTHEGEAGLAREIAGVPLQRGSPPDALADAILFLAGARSVTGQIIAVDGGQHIGWRTPDIAE